MLFVKFWHFILCTSGCWSVLSKLTFQTLIKWANIRFWSGWSTWTKNFSTSALCIYKYNNQLLLVHCGSKAFFLNTSMTTVTVLVFVISYQQIYLFHLSILCRFFSVSATRILCHTRPNCLAFNHFYDISYLSLITADHCWSLLTLFSVSSIYP